MTESRQHGENERTYLLFQPSSCSTDGPSSSDFHGYDEESDNLIVSRESSVSPSIQLPMLQRHSDRSGNGAYKNATKGKDFQKHRLLVGVVAVALAMVIALEIMPRAGKTPSIVPTSPGKKKHSGPRTFSTLDPVRDLGLVEFERPSSSRPPKVLTNKMKKQTAFPTNAWYQNLLLLRNGKPSQNHRAYAIPYVLDAAGPVPGLRVHPNHVGASTNQFQVNLIDTFGLTLGASLRATEKLEDAAFGYNVLETTPLGVTLEWVRN